MNGINIVSKAVPSKTTMPILECILIDATTNQIKFTTNDGNNWSYTKHTYTGYVIYGETGSCEIEDLAKGQVQNNYLQYNEVISFDDLPVIEHSKFYSEVLNQYQQAVDSNLYSSA